MAFTRLIAEGIGPFEKLDLDLSDGHGKPHLGPHILAGVNGSGKSTALRALAWVLDFRRGLFQYEVWAQLVAGREASWASAEIRLPSGDAKTIAAASGGDPLKVPKGLNFPLLSPYAKVSIGPDLHFWWWGETGWMSDRQISYAAYSPSRVLAYLPKPDLRASLADPFADCLRFEGTIRNEEVQSWLVGLFSKGAIARTKQQTDAPYSRTLALFQTALRKVCGTDVEIDVSIDPLQPCVRMGGKTLNFAQLPDGIRNTLGWLADFMMRQDLMKWDPALEGKRPGIILLDEVDAHLHPRWQRTLLPAMRAALPDVQIIVSTHSPFVISSCPGARIHLLDADEEGKAYLKESVDAPVGSSITATMRDIFDVESRFDIKTENELNEWRRLKDKESPTPEEDARLAELTESLASRNEELRLIVSTPPKLSRALMETLR